MPLGATASETVLGREHELAALRAVLDLATAGDGQIVVVTGAAGIGKTSVVEAFAASLPTGPRVHWGRCWEAGGAAAYWPWAQVLRSVVAEADAAALPALVGAAGADLALVVPELTDRLPGLTPAPSTGSPDARVRLFDAVAFFLRSAAGRRGMVVALEDLHWADEASLHLLRHLARDLGGASLVVVCTWRPEEGAVAPRVRRLLDAVAAGGLHLPLSGLGPEMVARLLERATGTAVTTETARTVWERTDGNPFFVSELARVLATGERNRLAPADGAGSLLVRRLGALPSDVRDVLTHAALLGREFAAPVLARVTGRSPAELLDALAEAESAGVVTTEGLGRWSFSHALLVQALAGTLDDAARGDAHRRIGAALEGDPGARDAALAHHFSEGGDAERTLRYSASAGEQALASLAFEEAAVHYGRALRALRRSAPSDKARRFDLLMSQARALFLAHDFAGARRAHGQAVKVARALADPERLARAALGFTGYLGGGLESVRLLEEALAALPLDDGATRSQVLVTLAAARAFPAGTAERPQVRALGQEGVDMGRRLGDPAALCRTLVLWHRLLLEIDLDSLPTRLLLTDEAASLAAEAGDGETAFWARGWRFGDLMEIGDTPAAGAELDAMAQEAERLRLPYLRWVVSHQRASLALHEGRLADAERLVDHALAAGEVTGSADVESVFAVQRLDVLRHQGRLEEMAGLARRRSVAGGEASQWRIAEALALALLGRVEEARGVLADGDLRPPERGQGNQWLALTAERGELAWLLDDREAAAALFTELAPFAERHVVVDVAIRLLGSSSRHVALLAAALRRWDEADTAFEAAHRHHRRLGTPVWLAHGWADHARVLLTRGAPGDRDRARALLAQAAEAYRELGMGFYERKVTAEAAAAPEGTAEGGAVFRREGDGWVVGYAGRVARLGETKGMGHLARLLARPAEEIAVTELDGAALDGERARQSVTRAVRTAIDRVGDVHPPLGEHLRRAVRTGHRCSYVPDPRAPVEWET